MRIGIFLKLKCCDNVILKDIFHTPKNELISKIKCTFILKNIGFTMEGNRGQ